MLELKREPCKMKEKRPVPQEIDTLFFHEEAVKIGRTGQAVVETGRNQTRSFDDNKSLNVEMAHDRTEQPVVETHKESVPDGCQTRSCHESISFKVGDETIRDRTGQPVVTHDELSHEQTILNEITHGHGLPNSRVTTFRCEACWELSRSRIG